MSEADWLEYNWNWKSPDNVREFVDEVLKVHEEYEYAWGSLSENGAENFFTQWWCPVQDAIRHIGSNFGAEDLIESIGHLLAPNGEFQECDPAIFDALLRYVEGFPNKYPGVYQYLELILSRDATYTSDWWDFSWYSFEDRYLTWTFWGPETLARSTNVDHAYLTRIFLLSFNSETPYKTFRARIALAMNRTCPESILNFLFENRNSADWLLNDPDEEGILIYDNGTYSIDENVESLEEMRAVADQTLSFDYESDEYWSTGPGAQYMGNLFDISWEAEDARTCLVAAFARNTALTLAQYEELLKEGHPLVKYFLYKNPSIPTELKVRFSLEFPTFTFIPYDQEVEDDETADVWVDLR